MKKYHYLLTVPAWLIFIIYILKEWSISAVDVGIVLFICFTFFLYALPIGLLLLATFLTTERPTSISIFVGGLSGLYASTIYFILNMSTNVSLCSTCAISIISFPVYIFISILAGALLGLVVRKTLKKLFRS